MPEIQTYRVHARDDRSHGHAVEAASFEDAAIAFVEMWRPPVDAGNEVSVIVREADSGLELCYRIDLDSGDAAPCPP
ncbi:DUF5961 family protein [Caulobacter sp. BE254]|uniref:DUF5961 family protein n=1 Tax=Caulobacter sp. BE254 TaxID=2817720 RepID=UPI0028674131|nr:DUF5961 family protein [Caulobacter sp. BE254]MDR7117209.1 hypothetical protein [Caulobacter sp. BE254]